MRYAWELMLGADRLNQHEFEQLTALDVPLLQRNQQWIELDPAEVAAAKQFLDERQATGEMTFLQSIRMVQAYLEQNGAQAAAVDIESALTPTVVRKGFPQSGLAAGGSGSGRTAACDHRASAQPAACD